MVLFNIGFMIRILAGKMAPDSIEKTALATHSGLYEFVVM